MIMKTSKAGLESIKKHEGCILQVYKDVAGLDTIGIGHLIKPGEKFTTITEQGALDLLAKDVVQFENALNRACKVTLNQNQFDALVSWGFNVGAGVYTTASLMTELNKSNFDAVPVKLLEWCKATINGKSTTVPGLLNRRKAEAALFQKPFTA